MWIAFELIKDLGDSNLSYLGKSLPDDMDALLDVYPTTLDELYHIVSDILWGKGHDSNRSMWIVAKDLEGSGKDQLHL